MLTEGILIEDLECAAQIVREGLGTLRQAANACGIALSALEAHVTNQPQTHRERNAVTPLYGSVRISTEQRENRGIVEATAGAKSVGAPTTNEAQESTDDFVFYRDDELWVWKRVGEKHHVVKSADQKFNYYLDCVADARLHGFTGKPLFIFAQSDLALRQSRRRLIMWAG